MSQTVHLARHQSLRQTSCHLAVYSLVIHGTSVLPVPTPHETKLRWRIMKTDLNWINVAEPTISDWFPGFFHCKSNGNIFSTIPRVTLVVARVTLMVIRVTLVVARVTLIVARVTLIVARVTLMVAPIVCTFNNTQTLAKKRGLIQLSFYIYLHILICCSTASRTREERV